MAIEFDPYSVLGVSADATVDEIKAAYRRIARRLHPDVNPNHLGAKAQFQDVTSAQDLLLDPLKRKSYDERAAKQQHSEDYYYSLQLTPSKRTITPLKEPQVLYLLAEIFPDPRAQETLKAREARLNLTLVLDHSNSMKGVRMEKVKIAAHQIIDNLADGDIISVISFNDRASTVIAATTATDKPALKAKVSMIAPAGGTEIYQGLNEGVKQNRQFLGPKLVNHIILLTDGHTYGDQEKCVELATQANKEGISISAMGLGSDWNDEFLDDLASKTGGNSIYIDSANSVVRYLNDQVRNLSNAFAERLSISIAPDPDVQLELAFKLSPHPQPLDFTTGIIPLGSMQANRPVSVLFQLQMPGEMKEGFRSIARIVASGDILENENQHMQIVSDISLEVTEEQLHDEPPSAILDALSKLTLYRLQERAQEALERGDVAEATRRLENLATRLLERGEDQLANQALLEARRVAHTSGLSDKGRKALKYQTRHLLLSSSNEDPL